MEREYRHALAMQLIYGVLYIIMENYVSNTILATLNFVRQVL